MDKPRPRSAKLDTVRDFRALRRACGDLLREIRLPTRFDIESLCDQLSERRGIPLRLIPMSLDPSTPSGLWVSIPTADLIVYESSASRPHQEHIIAHELGHMIWQHDQHWNDDNVAALFFPDLDPCLVKDMLQRAGYTDAQEREAETMATVILSRMQRAGHFSPASSDQPEAVIDRVKSSLLGHRGEAIE